MMKDKPTALLIFFVAIAVVTASPHQRTHNYHEIGRVDTEVRVDDDDYEDRVPLTVYTSAVHNGPLSLITRGADGRMKELSEHFQSTRLSTGQYAQKITFMVLRDNVPDLRDAILALTAKNETSAECAPGGACGIGIDCLDPDLLIAATLSEDSHRLRHMTMLIAANQYMGACTKLHKYTHEYTTVDAPLIQVPDPERHVELGKSVKEFHYEYLYPACDYSVDVRKYMCNIIDIEHNTVATDYTTPATVQGFYMSFSDTHSVLAHITDKENGQCGPVSYDFEYSIHEARHAVGTSMGCDGPVLKAATGSIEQSFPPYDNDFRTVSATTRQLAPGQALRGCVTSVYKNKRSEQVCDCIRWEPEQTLVNFPCSQPRVSTCDEENFVVEWDDLTTCAATTDEVKYRVVLSVNGQERYTEIVAADQLSLKIAHAGPGLEHTICIKSLLNCQETCCGDACGVTPEPEPEVTTTTTTTTENPCETTTTVTTSTTVTTPTTTTTLPTTTTTTTPATTTTTTPATTTTTTAEPTTTTETPALQPWCPHCGAQSKDEVVNRPSCPDTCGEACCTTFTTPPVCVKHEGCVQTMPQGASASSLTCGVHNPNIAPVTIQLLCAGDRSRSATYGGNKWYVNLGQVTYADVKDCYWEVTATNCGCENGNTMCKKQCPMPKYAMCPDCPTNVPQAKVSQLNGSTKRYSIIIEDDRNLCENGNELTYVVNFSWKHSRVNSNTGEAACPSLSGSVLAQYDYTAAVCRGLVTFDYTNNCYDQYFYEVQANTRSDFYKEESDSRCWARQWWDCNSDSGGARCEKRDVHE